MLRIRQLPLQGSLRLHILHIGTVLIFRGGENIFQKILVINVIVERVDAEGFKTLRRHINTAFRHVVFYKIGPKGFQTDFYPPVLVCGFCYRHCQTIRHDGKQGEDAAAPHPEQAERLFGIKSKTGGGNVP